MEENWVRVLSLLPPCFLYLLFLSLLALNVGMYVCLSHYVVRYVLTMNK